MPLEAAALEMAQYGAVEANQDGFCNPDQGSGLCVWPSYVYGDDEQPTETPGVVLAVATDDPRFHTPAGHRVGDPITDFIQEFGRPSWVGRTFGGGVWLEWWRAGFWAKCHGGRCWVLGIFARR